MSDFKYKLTNKTIKYKGKTLYQIEALKDFITVDDYKVTKGDLGGYIEDEFNLSDGYDSSWITKHVKVLGNARVAGSGFISGYVTMKDNSYCFGRLRVFGMAVITNKEVIQETEDIIALGYKYVIGVVNKRRFPYDIK